MSGDVLLEVEDLHVGYGQVPVLIGCDLRIERGAAVALLGRNGAGKSTMLRALSGLLPPSRGRVTFDGRDITGAHPRAIVDAGLSHVAEGHRIFRRQTVRSNLELGMYGLKISRAEERERIDEALALFPPLADAIDAGAGVLSGGQQQMLAIAQALVRRPKLLLIDEPSLGLAPIVVEAVFATIAAMRAEGVTILLVEQVIDRALALADHGYVLQNGQVAASGSPEMLRTSDVLAQAYLAAPGRPRAGAGPGGS